eukprot:scaffold316242_cov28-Tisochrysis_lutea.AAC.1
MPDEHTLFTVVQHVESARPAARAAWRAGACPTPALTTLPIQHCSTASFATPAFASAPIIAAAPSCGAERDASEPLNPPSGVLAAPTMQTGSRIWVEKR